MELQEILSVAIGTLIVVVISHFAVFWVVRTLYPPQNVYVNPPPLAPLPPQEVVFTPPVKVDHVVLPTYETPVSAQAPPEERKGPPPPEDTSIRGNSGMGGAKP